MGIWSRARTRLAHVAAVAHGLAATGEAQAVRSHGRRLFLRDQLGLAGRAATLRLRSRGREFDFATDSVADFSLLHDLFIREEYGRALGLQAPRTIVDLGSNIGASVIYFRLLFPHAHIAAYEPSPQAFRRLRRNTAALGNISLHNEAVGPADGTVTFYENPRRSVSSSLRRRSRGDRAVVVPQVCFDTVASRHGGVAIDLVKFDVEGGEYDFFRSAGALARVGCCLGELHPDLMGCGTAAFCDLFPEHDIQLETLSPRRLLFFGRRRAGGQR